MESDEATSPGGRRPYVPTRSAVSNNWRMKDESPRADQPAPQRRQNDSPRFQRRDNNNGPEFSTPRSGPFNRPQRESSEIPSEVTSPRLYVGNLLYSAQTEDVENFFVANGFKPTNLSMSIDPMTGRNPSYCFVDLETVEDAKQAIEELNGKDIMGRSVRINPGVAKREGASGPKEGLRVKSFETGRGSWRDSNAPGGTDKEQSYKPSFDRWNRNDASQQITRPQEQGRRLYVGGLPRMEPQSAVDTAMQDLFQGFEIGAVSKIISPHPSKTTEPGDHYYLFVDLVNLDDVDAAIEALNESVSPFSTTGEGRLKVNKARGSTGRKGVREQGDRPGPEQGERTYTKPSWREQ